MTHRQYLTQLAVDMTKMTTYAQGMVIMSEFNDYCLEVSADVLESHRDEFLLARSILTEMLERLPGEREEGSLEVIVNAARR